MERFRKLKVPKSDFDEEPAYPFISSLNLDAQNSKRV